MFQGAYQNGTKFWHHRWAGDLPTHLTKEKLKEGTQSRYPAFPLGCHYSNPLQKNFCQWFTSKLHVQTLPRCCKTNSPHRCTLPQAALLSRQSKKTEVKKTNVPWLWLNIRQVVSLLYIYLSSEKRGKGDLNPSVKHAERWVMAWLRCPLCNPQQTRTSNTSGKGGTGGEPITKSRWSQNCQAITSAFWEQYN